MHYELLEWDVEVVTLNSFSLNFSQVVIVLEYSYLAFHSIGFFLLFVEPVHLFHNLHCIQYNYIILRVFEIPRIFCVNQVPYFFIFFHQLREVFIIVQHTHLHEYPQWIVLWQFGQNPNRILSIFVYICTFCQQIYVIKVWLFLLLIQIGPIYDCIIFRTQPNVEERLIIDKL